MAEGQLGGGRISPTSPRERIILGRVAGLFGVRGWVKVYSYTRPLKEIIEYDPWLVKLEDGWQSLTLVEGRTHGKGIIASLQGYRAREQADQLIGADIAVWSEQLPPLGEGEFYWTQLEGLRVVNLEGRELGAVSYLFETGANDVMVVMDNHPQTPHRRLVPYVRGDVIKHVDVDAGVIKVDWDADF